MTKLRLHLSTWLVLLIAAAVLLAVNTVSSYSGHSRGWPFVASEIDWSATHRQARQQFNQAFIPIGEEEAFDPKPQTYFIGNVICNIGVAFAILLAIAVPVEFSARRGWLRFHLATFLVLSVVAAGLVGVNLRSSGDEYTQVLGWPQTFYRYPRRSGLSGAPAGFQRFIGAGVELDLLQRPVQLPRFPEIADMYDDDRRAFWINFGIAGSILIATAAFSEAIIRRRARLRSPLQGESA